MYTETYPRHRSPRTGPRGLPDPHLARIAAVFASTGAGVVHTMVTDDHWTEWPLSGVFFGLISLVQFGWAMAAALSRAPALMVAGILANAGSIVLWAVSRAVGVPFGPHAGVPEAVSTADVLTVVLEVAVCAGAAWSLRRPRWWIRSSPALAAAVAVVGLGTLAVTVPAMRDAAAGHSHGPGSGHSDGHQHAPGEGHATPAPTSTKSAEPGPRSSKPEPSPSSGRTHDPGDGHTHEH